jgi:5'-nucleotidase
MNTLLVDMDGVIADFETEFYERWRRRYPDEYIVEPDARRGWNMELQYPEHLRTQVRDVYMEPGFFSSLKPVAGALEALNVAAAAGFDVRVCTAPMKHHRTCAQEKIGWLHDHLGSDFAHRAIITRDKTLIHGLFLLDDRQIIEGVNQRPTWRHIIFDTIYNREPVLAHEKRWTWEDFRGFVRTGSMEP